MIAARTARVAGLVLVTMLALAGGARAQAPEVVGPYAGEIPFECELQQAGTGTEVPDPEADPYCVEFDKTNQNVTGFGIVEFTAQEPGRVAAASDKCFYFQRDHWRGTVDQGTGPEAWSWDGDYFFDRARGVGGVSVRSFQVGGAPADATPYVPAAYHPYFDHTGGGGALVELESKPDPSCASRVDTPEERDEVYAGRSDPLRCIPPAAAVRGRRLGPLRLGMRRGAALRKLGPPTNRRRGVDRWCLVGKGRLRAEYRRSAGPATLLMSTGRGHAARGVGPGDRRRRARRKLELDPRLRLGAVTVFEEARAPGGRRLLFGIDRRRVRWIALADGRALGKPSALRRALRRTR